MEPTSTEEWISRIEEMLADLTLDDIKKSAAGNEAAQAVIQGLAAELQSALLYLLSISELAQAQIDVLIELVDSVIDTIQAILLALGIVFLLKKVKKKKDRGFTEVKVSERSARKGLGDRTKPIPSRQDSQDPEKEAQFLKWRLEWTIHYILTLLQGAQLREELEEGEELIWVSRKDASVCPVCKTMDGKKSVNGDFLPTILKYFPNYKSYAAEMMLFPHAHPRCRCVARRESK